MSLALYPLAAACGAVVGSFVHESTHAAVAAACGVLDGYGWQGGLAGGPYVDFEPETRWQSEAVRKAPLSLGLVALAALIVAYPGPTLPWVAAAGAVAGLLWTSPQDLFVDAARRP
ncbi:hypothetical protein AFNJKBDN_CDS0048 [Halorubrum virus V_ICIS4]|nr:hypothetical protein AFNJKBDN_CDS0048 [Halorubrum virus V_ICIS4]